jgi:hypothetical protein
LKIFYSKDDDDDTEMEESKTDNEQKVWIILKNLNFDIKVLLLL